MQIILIRHSERERNGGLNDAQQPLTCDGREEAVQLRERLAQFKIQPEVFLCSRNQHAQEMAQLLKGEEKSKARVPIQPLDALTPHSQTSTLEEIIQEAGEKSCRLEKKAQVAIVGHEPRLSQLLVQLTSQRARPFRRGEAACLEAPSLDDFCTGRGKLLFRYPVADYQEDTLRGKVSSKMTVSTFLAGFSTSALIMLLDGELTQLRKIAILCFTAALILFIAAVYIYDRLSMPEGFWAGLDRRGRVDIHGKKFRELCERNGDLFAHMVWTWNWVFTPAVVINLAGFLVFLADRGESPVIVAATLILAAGFGYYLLARPHLGTD